MAEVFVEFDTSIVGPDGIRWVPQVCGDVADDGLWEGWIEFTPTAASGEPVRTQRETQQPNRDDLMYWAQGLTQAYLEQALVRALAPRPTPSHLRTPGAHFDGPARRVHTTPSHSLPRPILNPFEVYLQGEGVLRRELSALSVSHLRNIVVGYRLATSLAADESGREALTAAILDAVRGETGTSPQRTGSSL